MNKKKNKFGNWLLKVATAQAYITTISMPILAFWGLPISLATFFGNVIASPLITSYIFISALVFFTELLNIPNWLLLKSLELNTFVISTFINIGDKSWLIGLPQSHFLIAIPFIATFIIFYFKDLTRFLSLAFLLAISIFIAKLTYQKEFKEIIKLQNSKIVLSSGPNGVELHCKNNIINNPSINSWLEYKLLPVLYKKTGANKINTIYFDKEPSPKLISKLQEYLFIDHIKVNNP